MHPNPVSNHYFLPVVAARTITTDTVLNLDAITTAALQTDPYAHIINSGFIQPQKVKAVIESFPDIRITGFRPASELSLKGAFKQLITELEGEALSSALSEVFDLNLTKFPRLVTVRKYSALHEGRIHCDSKSKIMSLLIYLNNDWPYATGKLRVLYDRYDIHHYAAEINPSMGTIFAFVRSDCSWHGHEPFEGERRVIQVAWIASQKDINRKRRRHYFSGWFKKLSYTSNLKT